MIKEITQQRVAVVLVNDADYYTNGSEYEKIMSKIIKTYSKSHEATGGRIKLIKISS